jgi:hypothetical protein
MEPFAQCVIFGPGAMGPATKGFPPVDTFDCIDQFEPLIRSKEDWPAPGSEDTELGVSMEPEVDHGEAEVYAGVQA